MVSYFEETQLKSAPREVRVFVDTSSTLVAVGALYALLKVAPYSLVPTVFGLVNSPETAKRFRMEEPASLTLRIREAEESLGKMKKKVENLRRNLDKE